MPTVIPLTDSGEKTFDFNGQLAVKSSVKIGTTNQQGGGGTAQFHSWPAGAEVTQEDGTVTVSSVKYSWRCTSATPEIPGTWVPASQMGGNPYYNYTVFVPGTPGRPAGTIDMTITWTPWTAPPSPPETIATDEIPTNISNNNQISEVPFSPQTRTEWIMQKVILDEGLWVSVEDDYDLIDKAHLVNKASDIIDLLVANEDDAERIGKDFIWESARKNEGYIPTIFNPFIIPGKYIETALSSQNIYNLVARARGISKQQDWQSDQTKIFIKERGKDSE